MQWLCSSAVSRYLYGGCMYNCFLQLCPWKRHAQEVVSTNHPTHCMYCCQLETAKY